MSQVNRVRVINRQGWAKEYALKGQIIYIGSRKDNDIALPDAADVVQERHLMLRPSAVNPTGYALFNLSTANVHHYAAGKGGSEPAGELVNPGAAVELGHGHKIVFVDHELFYFVGAQTSAMFELGITLKSTTLTPTKDLTGYISIKNTGAQNAAQFAVVVEGLPRDCIEIEAGPLLFSGVQKEVAFTLKHPKQAQPPAGPGHPIQFHVTADEAYPGERATVVQLVEIAPYHARQVGVIGFVPGALVWPS